MSVTNVYVCIHVYLCVCLPNVCRLFLVATLVMVGNRRDMPAMMRRGITMREKSKASF